ncbi:MULTISPECIES: hypothetical protein [unclassified Pseudoalteromonas]|uniref:hypothetical protein n=1 Tax=unclassified Pseudoalteromonas TaxID=194690 RepID=UPI0014869FAD|nr:MULTISPECIES: hypothetical protein [unclassified Pseudoalteromonas]
MNKANALLIYIFGQYNQTQEKYLGATPIPISKIINITQYLFEPSKFSPHTGHVDDVIGVPSIFIVLTTGEVIPDLHFLHFINIPINFK